jgi:uncharacterized protein (TIGR00255 family)
MPALASMTGYADATLEGDFGLLGVELKSVNSRFLELTLRLPEELRSLEPAMRERIGARLARGKVECRVSHQPAAGGEARLNTTALGTLDNLARELARHWPQARPLGIAELLRWPGVLESGASLPADWPDQALSTLERALDALQGAREREGAALAALLRERCDGVDAIVATLRDAVPRMLGALQEKLRLRLEEALAPALGGVGLPRAEIQERIRQEVTLYGIRADVTEELDRLATHVNEVRRTLREGGAVGRRLDFLMQELNREANTLASKASAVDMSQAAIELKLLIEQMREQLQNLA